jgi:hypothetical protein
MANVDVASTAHLWPATMIDWVNLPGRPLLLLLDIKHVLDRGRPSSLRACTILEPAPLGQSGLRMSRWQATDLNAGLDIVDGVTEGYEHQLHTTSPFGSRELIIPRLTCDLHLGQWTQLSGRGWTARGADYRLGGTQPTRVIFSKRLMAREWRHLPSRSTPH